MNKRTNRRVRDSYEELLEYLREVKSTIHKENREEYFRAVKDEAVTLRNKMCDRVGVAYMIYPTEADSEYTPGEMTDFIEEARGILGIPNNVRITISMGVLEELLEKNMSKEVREWLEEQKDYDNVFTAKCFVYGGTNLEAARELVETFYNRRKKVLEFDYTILGREGIPEAETFYELGGRIIQK